MSQHTLNRVFLTNKSYTPESLASELQAKLNESSICRPSPGYEVTFDEELGVLKITRESLADKIFFLASDDLLQQLSPPFATLQTYDQSNGMVPLTPHYTQPKSAMSLFGLGPKSNENTSLSHLLTLGNDLCNTHNTGALGLRRIIVFVCIAQRWRITKCWGQQAPVHA